MNCFEWQSRSSDFLDGTLEAPVQASADAHLASCPSCRERHQRYRLLLTSIASQPRVALPPALRKAPLAAMIPERTLEPGENWQRRGLRVGARSRWERVPWWLRTTIEGTGIVLLILFGISTGPKLRKLYERRMEQSLGEFTDSFNTDDAKLAEAAPPEVALARGNAGAETSEGQAAGAGDDYAGEDEEADDDVASEETGDTDLRVGASEIWRFNLKTDSPHEVRHRIVQMLTELRVPPGTVGFGGVEAPGGIQFDLLVSKGVVLDLKQRLQKLAPKPTTADNGTGLLGDGFTWYKNKSKRKVPEGRARVVIWLSQT